MTSVPQGSILGPLLFSLYVREIEDNASFHNISVHMYADDIQCYLSFSKDVPLCVVNDKLKAFVNDIYEKLDGLESFNVKPA